MKRANPNLLVNLNGAVGYKNTISGFGHDVVTWGGPLAWRKQQAVQSTQTVADKRDRYAARSQFCFAVAGAGEFEWSVAFCPNLDGQGTKRPVHCHFCNAAHNWCVFYRRSSDGQYLGHSGCDCFGEVCRNLKLDNVEAVVEAVKKERSRNEKFRRTMEKVNDFKRDFPGLYENREWLQSRANPYSPLWMAAMRQLNRAEGVDEAFCAGCAGGKFDRAMGYYYRSSIRRLPSYLKWAAETIGRAENIEALKAATEVQASKDVYPFHRDAPRPYQTVQSQITPQVIAAAQAVAAPVPATLDIVQQAEFLKANGYGWSYLVTNAIRGHASAGSVRWIQAEFEKIKAKQAKTDKPAPVQTEDEGNRAERLLAETITATVAERDTIDKSLNTERLIESVEMPCE